MAVYGGEFYLKAGRWWQAHMVAALTVRNAFNTFSHYDAIDHTDRKPK